MKMIYILGNEDLKSKLLMERVQKAVKDLGVPAKIQRIEKLGKSSFSFLPTPILAIDNEILSMGKVLSCEEIKNYLI